MTKYRLSRRKDMPCFAEVTTITAYPLHSHEFYEIELVSGNGCHNVVDGRDYLISGTMCFLYLPYTRHYYYSDNGSGVQISRIGFSEVFLPKDFMNLILSGNEPFSVDITEQQQDEIRRQFTEIVSMYFGNLPDRFCELYLKAMIGKLVVCLYELLEKNQALSATNLEDTMSKVYGYIQKNFNKQISLAALADVSGMSTGYFSRYFREATGMTYSHYVTGIRMNYAVSLLKMTDYSLRKISQETGYYSESGFIKSFIKYFGFHPNTFRASAGLNQKKEERKMNTEQTEWMTPVPIPKKFLRTTGLFSIKPTIYAPSDFIHSAEVLKGYLKRIFDIDFDTVRDMDEAGILMQVSPELSEETYQVSSENGQVRIMASSTPGFSHGGSVILQMAEKRNDALYISGFSLEDTPDLKWRGFMVDLARGIYPMRDILLYADICYFYRLSVLHLHFTDAPVDSWYKLPAPHFPKLDCGETYSYEEIETVKKYLHDRGILLLPEIEMPGHARPLIANYPDKFGSNHKGTVCPGHEGVFEALDTLISDVCDMFPDAPYIHIGCDEVQHSVWNDCPKCRTFMQEMNIPSTEALYTYMVDRCTRMVLDKGRTPIVWEGFPKEGTDLLSRDIIVMVFQSTYQNAIELTESGFRVINTSWQPLYIVPSRPKYWHPSDIFRWKYNRWLYEDAIDDQEPMDVTKTDLIMGGEVCLWEGQTYRKDGPIVEQNMAVLAERLWNTEANCNYSRYEKYKKAVDGKLLKMIDDTLNDENIGNRSFGEHFPPIS